MTTADPAELRAAVAHLVVDPDTLDGDHGLAPDPDDEHHLRRVLRIRAGERVTVTDGRGRWRPTVAVLEGPTLRLEPSGPVVHAPTPQRRLVVAAAIPKGDRLDWMIQKVCELGAWSVQLLDPERASVRWKPGKVDALVARTQRVADAACRQSRRVWWPTIEPPRPARDILPGAFVAEPGGRPLIDVAIGGDPAGDVVVAIGPEGGWAPAELADGGPTVSLGPHVLRTETAAVAAAALFAGAAARSLE